MEFAENDVCSTTFYWSDLPYCGLSNELSGYEGVWKLKDLSFCTPKHNNSMSKEKLTGRILVSSFSRDDECNSLQLIILVEAHYVKAVFKQKFQEQFCLFCSTFFGKLSTNSQTNISNQLSQHTCEARGQPLPVRKTPYCSEKTQTLRMTVLV